MHKEDERIYSHFSQRTRGDEDSEETTRWLNPKKATIYVYKIRATENFYYAYYSLMFAKENLRQQGKNKKADKYESVAEDYLYQREWMAYRAIAATQINWPPPIHERWLIGLNQHSPIVQNPGYVEESAYGSEDPFPEAMKGCPSFDKLKACFGFWQQR